MSKRGDFRIELESIRDGNGRRYWRPLVDGRAIAKAWAWKDIDSEAVWLTRRGAKRAGRRALGETPWRERE